MRRVMILVVSVLTIVTMALSPAFAHDWDNDGWDEEGGFWVFVPAFVVFDVDFDCDWDDCDFDDHDWDGNGIVQDAEQEAESGEINQSFDVS